MKTIDYLDKVVDFYTERLYRVVEQIYQDEIKPYLDENQWELIAGNGIWFIRDKQTGEQVNDKDIDDDIWMLLSYDLFDNNMQLGECCF